MRPTSISIERGQCLPLLDSFDTGEKAEPQSRLLGRFSTGSDFIGDGAPFFVNQEEPRAELDIPETSRLLGELLSETRMG